MYRRTSLLASLFSLASLTPAYAELPWDPFVFIDRPAIDETLSGATPISGWATGTSGIASLTVQVDGQNLPYHSTYYGTYRPDVCQHVNPSDPGCPYVGWESFLDSTQYADGVHTIAVWAYDWAGRWGSSSYEFRIDNNPPTLDYIQPAHGEVVNSTEALVVQAIDYGSPGNEVDRVEYYVNGGHLATQYSNGSYFFNYYWNTLTQGVEGANTVTFRAVDAAGNVATASRTVTVDNTPPSASVTAPGNGAYVRGTQTIRASASDSTGIGSVRFWIDGAYHSGDVTSPYTASWNTAALSDGAHRVHVVAWDLPGNPGQSATHWVTVDNTPPVASMTAPANGSTVGGLTSITVSASDNTGISEVRFFMNDQLFGTDTTAPFSAPWNTGTILGQSPDGLVHLYALAYDRAGNLAATETVSVAVDNTPPELDFRLPEHGAIVGGTETIVVHALDRDSPGDEIERLEYWVNGQLLATQYSSGVYIFNYHWNTLTQAVESSNTVLVKAFDPLGNVATASHAVVVDNQDPTATLTAPAAGAYVKGTVTLQATGSDANGLTSMRFWVDGAHLAGDATVPYTASWNTTAVADGSHSLYAVAWDVANNPGQSTTHQVTVDNTPPAVSLTAPGNGATVAGAVELTASASDNLGVANVRFFIDGVRVTIDSSPPYSFTWNTAGVADGNHVVRARAFDHAGNTTYSAQHTVTVENVDFSLGFVPEEGMEPDTRGVEPGGTATLRVLLTRADGSSDPVGLSVVGLPSTVTASTPPTLSPGQAATVQLSASGTAADGAYAFQLQATGGSETVTLPATLVVADLPNVTSVTPDRVSAGAVETVTIRGTDFEGATVWVATEKPFPEAPDRIFPLVTILSGNPEGTELTVQVDATTPGVEGFYNLVVQNAAGGASAPIEVLPDRPVIYMYTPSEPADSDLYVFTALGANLAGASLSSNDPAHVRFHGMDNSSDEHLLGLVEILPGAAPGLELVVANAAGHTALPMVVSSSPPETARVVAASSTTGPDVLMQQFAPFHEGEHSPPDWTFPRIPRDPIFSIPCGGRFRRSERLHYTYRLSDIVGRTGKEVLDFLKSLPLSSTYQFDLELLEIFAQLEISIQFICHVSLDRGLVFTDLDICFSGAFRTEVIGVSAVECSVEFCAGGSGGGCDSDLAPGGTLASFSLDNTTSCTEPEDASVPPGPCDGPCPETGDRDIEVEQAACCADTLNLHMIGTGSTGLLFDRELPPIETDVDPGTCSTGTAETAYTVVAWVDGSAVVPVLEQLTPQANGDLVARLNTPGFCHITLGLIWSGALGFAGVNTAADRSYVNAWAMALGGDLPPPPEFLSLDPALGDLATFIAQRNYRVMAHLLTAHDGTAVQFRSSPIARAGLTKDPCSPFRLLGLSEPQVHPDHGKHGIRSGSAYVLTEARVGELGQKMDRNLNCPTCEVGETTPWIWAIPRGNSQGQLAGTPDLQIFPTYWIYVDGQKFIEVPQSDVEQFIALDETSQRTDGGIP